MLLEELFRPKIFLPPRNEAQLSSFSSFKTPKDQLVPDLASIGKNRPEGKRFSFQKDFKSLVSIVSPFSVTGKVLLPEDLHFMRQLLHEMFTARYQCAKFCSLRYEMLFMMFTN